MANVVAGRQARSGVPGRRQSYWAAGLAQLTGSGLLGLVACWQAPAVPRGPASGSLSGGAVYPLTFTSRLTTGQFTTNPLGPNGLPAGNPVTLPSATCCKAAEKSVWRRLSPAATAASVHVARWTSHIGL